MTPQEIEVLNIMEKNGQAMVRQVAKKLNRSTVYTRNLLDYLTVGKHVQKLSRDMYQITSKGIDAIINEYLYTLTALEKRINKYLDDEWRLVEVINWLRLRKKEIGKSIGGVKV